LSGKDAQLLENIKKLIASGRYRVRQHAVRHMLEEGFAEEDLIEALAGDSRILEHYPDDFRCLILGYFSTGVDVRAPLHAVCDYSNGGLVDIVTAYVPQRPWWLTPTKGEGWHEGFHGISVLRMPGPGSQKDDCPGVRKRRDQGKAFRPPSLGLLQVRRSLFPTWHGTTHGAGGPILVHTGLGRQAA
jgi:hypothetical protein